MKYGAAFLSILLSIDLLVADQLGSSEMINCQILYIYTTCNL